MCDGAPCRQPPRTPFSHKSTFLWREQTRRKVTGSVRQSTPYARRRVRAEERRHTSVRPSHGPEGRRPSPRCPPHRDPVYGDMPEEGGHSRQCQPSGNNLCGSREHPPSGGVEGNCRAVKLTATRVRCSVQCIGRSDAGHRLPAAREYGRNNVAGWRCRFQCFGTGQLDGTCPCPARNPSTPAPRPTG
jgi:hypothetical protein